MRVFDGSIPDSTDLRLMSNDKLIQPLEIGVFSPWLLPVDEGLSCGEVGYIATGLKDVRECRVGDTITLMEDGASDALPGYRPLQSMIFAGLFPSEGSRYDDYEML